MPRVWRRSIHIRHKQWLQRKDAKLSLEQTSGGRTKDPQLLKCIYPILLILSCLINSAGNRQWTFPNSNITLQTTTVVSTPPSGLLWCVLTQPTEGHGHWCCCINWKNCGIIWSGKYVLVTQSCKRLKRMWRKKVTLPKRKKKEEVWML